MQGGYLSLFYSICEKPLEYWSKQKSRTGSIRRVLDDELHENVLEIQDVEEQNCQKTWIMCPPDMHQTLNIKLAFLMIILKSTNSIFHFQLQIADKENIKHLIDFSNVETKRSAGPKSTIPKMHVLLEQGWNKLEVDLCHLAKILGAEFGALCKIRITANCRLRRVYFMDRHYDDNEMTLGLFHGFIDMYMLKWGIKEVERATQTRRIPGKLLTLCDNSVRPAIGFNKLFLKHLQSKCDEIVEEYFAKQSSKPLKDFLEFKRKAKIKPYVIPDRKKISNSRSSSDTSIVHLNDIRNSFKCLDNHLFTKTNDEKKDDRNKIQLTNKLKGAEMKSPIYNVCTYRYPDVRIKKENIREKIINHKGTH